MARVRELVIHPPLGGVVRDQVYQNQEPYTSPNALNFIGRDLKTGRKRTAVRPRLATYGTGDSTWSDEPIRGIYQVNIATNQTLTRGLFGMCDGTLYRYIAGTFTATAITGLTSTAYISGTAYLQMLILATGTNPSIFDCTGNTTGVLGTGAFNETDGTSPTNCTIVAEWAGRLVLAGDTSTPHAVYMSRVGDPLDWQYNDTDVGAAANFTALDGGNIGEKVTALISHNRECLLIGATDSLHVVRGNPLDGGRIEILSHTIGPLSQSAWCKTDDEQTVMLTRNGLYVMAPGCGAPPVPLSRARIPDSLIGVDTSTYEAHIGYDSRFHGLMIALTSSGGGEYWWMDWETGAFWPLDFTSQEKPYSLLRFDPLDAADTSGLLFGGAGDIRRFDRTNTGAITSAYFYIGPFKLSSSPFSKGIVQKMRCTFSANTTDTTGTVALYCAESGEAAYAAAVADTAHRKFSMTISNQNDNHTSYPRVGGHAGVIKVTQGSTTAHTALEEIALTIAEAGVMR